jgi:predicted metal-dependent phosphoesterase TrpH
MILDLHCHSKYSRDNNLDPEALVRRAIELGLDGVCFTEHFSFDCSRPVYRIEVPRGFLILRGVEVSTDCGHILIYGIKDDSWNRWGRNHDLRLRKVVDSAHDHGGICVPAHPFRGHECLGERLYYFQGLDALETHNGGNSPEQNAPAVAAAMKLGLPSVGGSDCHRLERVGTAVTVFDNPIRNMDDLVREIKAGNCRGQQFES